MEQFIRDTRKKLDSIIILIGTDITGSREVSLVKTNLQEGSMFLGLVLGALGAINPYPESTNPDSQKIEERADQAEAPFLFPENDMTQTSKIKHLRAVIQETIDDGIKTYDEYFEHDILPKLMSAGGEDAKLSASVDNLGSFSHEARMALTRAKLWLGMQLNNIHQESKNAGVS